MLKLDLYIYFSPKWVQMEETLMEPNMSFLIKDDELLEKHNEIWENVKNIIKKEFDSKPVYNEKYLKAKIKWYNGNINTNFHNNKIPREGSQFIWSLVILEDSVFRTGKNNYLQVFFKYRYAVKEKNIPKYIIDNTKISSDSDRENFYGETYDEGNSNEEPSDEKNSGEENEKIVFKFFFYI